MKVHVMSKNVAKVELEYQVGGLSQDNIKSLINLLERAFFKMREMEMEESGVQKDLGICVDSRAP